MVLECSCQWDQRLWVWFDHMPGGSKADWLALAVTALGFGLAWTALRRDARAAERQLEDQRAARALKVGFNPHPRDDFTAALAASGFAYNGVTLRVQLDNKSDYPISDIKVWLSADGRRSPVFESLPVMPGGEQQVNWQVGPVGTWDGLRADVTFTDVVGNRWHRDNLGNLGRLPGRRRSRAATTLSVCVVAYLTILVIASATC